MKGLDLLAGVLEELARLPVVVGEFLTQLRNDVLGQLGVIGPALQSALGLGQVTAEGLDLAGRLRTKLLAHSRDERALPDPASI